MDLTITENELKGEGCSSDKDLVTFVDWMDTKPTVFINFIAKIDKPGRLNCYDGDSLRTWLMMPENTFAEWIPHSVIKGMNDMGYGGGPELSKLFVKLYTGEYLIYDENVRLLKRNIARPIKFDAIFTGTKRIGNIQGTFGMGDTHGQIPGYGIYELKLRSKIEDSDLLADDEVTEYQPENLSDDEYPLGYRSPNDIILDARTYEGMEDEEYYRDFSDDEDTASSDMIPNTLFDLEEEIEIPYSPYRPPRTRIPSPELISSSESESSSSESEDEMDIVSEGDVNINLPNTAIQVPLAEPVMLPRVKAKGKAKTLPPLPPPRWVPVAAKYGRAKMKM